MVATASRRSQMIAAVVATPSGLLVAYLIHAHPEGLRVPAWVAYVAASAFVLVGLGLFAGVVGVVPLQRWLGVAATACLFVVSAWVAFGPGEIEFPFLPRAVGEAVC